MNLKLYVGNDNLLLVSGLKNNADGSYLNGIGMQVDEIVDANGVQVTGQAWPHTVSYVAGTDGDYRTTLTSGINLVAGEIYTVKLTADAGIGLLGHWEFPVQAETRTVVA